MLYANGEKYTGEFKNSVREGKGIVTFVGGDQYDGEWKDNKPNGFGSLIHALDGSRLDGQFVDGFRVEGNVRYLLTGERVVEEHKEAPQHPHHEGSTTEPKENYKESILAKVKPHGSNSTTLSSLNSRKPNSSLSRAIEDIRKKNSGSG